MLCALTVRQLKPGTSEQFLEAFRPPESEGGPPSGWVRFNALRDGDRLVTFGFFDGTREELEASQDDHGYAERRAAADQYVDEVVVNGVFDVVADMNVST